MSNKLEIINDARQNHEEKKNFLQLLRELFLKLIHRDEKFALFAHEMGVIMDEIQTTNMLSLNNFNKLMDIVEDQKDVMDEIKALTDKAEVYKERYSKIQENLAECKNAIMNYSIDDWKNNFIINKVEIEGRFKGFIAYKACEVAFGPKIKHSETEEYKEVAAIVCDGKSLFFCSTMDEAMSIMYKGIPAEYEAFKEGKISFEECIGDKFIDNPERIDETIEAMMTMIPGAEAYQSALIGQNIEGIEKNLDELSKEAEKNEAFISKYGHLDENKQIHFNPNVSLEINTFAEGRENHSEPEEEVER